MLKPTTGLARPASTSEDSVKCLGAEGHHEAEGLPWSGTHHSPLLMRDLDCLQPTR